ncbi:GNAT family N-acetyltransferase [Actinomadura rudentiformis]|uniref:GNAT family N-acetyltransferase n=1 Tax=Actinomadura rudentiformis TaxID=359158 RepID=UPI001CEF9884|nr:GNAT family N-acetyltransferase [Actinomadura rudentiformis]
MAVESTVRRLSADDAKVVAGVLARAFDDDPVWQWIIPEADGRVRRLSLVFELITRKVHQPRGGCEVAGRGSGEIEAAALWDPPGEWKVPLSAQLGQLVPLARSFGLRLPAALRALGAIEKRHPKEPHWYLAVLGTDPAAQGNGLGGALLRSRLGRCDEERLPAYLESSKESNVPYYEQFGFRVTDRFVPPGGCPPVWRMWRPSA